MTHHRRTIPLILVSLSLLVAGQAKSSPTGKWTFDGDTSDSVGSNDAIRLGDTSYVPGKVSRALRFDTERGGAYMSSILSEMGLGDFTVSVWIKYEGHFTGDGRAGIITVGRDSGDRGIDISGAPAGSRYSWWANGEFDKVVVTHAAPWRDSPGSWHHVVLGRQNGQQFLCLNGRIVANSATSMLLDMAHSDRTWLGFNPVDESRHGFAGVIDELQVYEEWIGAAGCDLLFTKPEASWPSNDL